MTEPVAGNYYPVTTSAAVSADGATLAVLVDRAQARVRPSFPHVLCALP